jgi:hypothetical protein
MATGRHKKSEVLKVVTDEGVTTARGRPLSAQTLQANIAKSVICGVGDDTE